MSYLKVVIKSYCYTTNHQPCSCSIFELKDSMLVGCDRRDLATSEARIESWSVLHLNRQ